MSLPARAVSIHIDLLRVEGVAFDAREVRHFERALHAALRQLAQSSPPGPWASAVLARSVAEPIRAMRADRPAQLGADVAGSLWQAIARAGGDSR